jgi:WD40 repeat protein/tRNA A-37 threonylcarbamoyl transferase component Bud32
MSEATPVRAGTLPLSAARRVNQVCNRFELAWQAGPRPGIEDYLAGVPEPERAALVRELVALDIAYRRQAGEDPQADDYRARFPGLTLTALRGDRAAEPPGAAADLPAVPGYELLGELGRGAMGVVYKARQTKLKRLAALKMILAGPHASSSELARFRREAEAIARLQHPNIVQIYEVGEQDGRPFFSLEYVDGGSLAQQLSGTPWPARRAAELVRTLARAMHAAHAQGVVHRDLKPANVLLTRDGQPKITDFGLAKQLDESVAQTQSGAIVGTPSYMAPEQAGGKGGPVGPAADVYALGAILYELVTGRPPFRAETPLDTVLQLLSEEPVPPRRLQPKLPRDLETICLKALAKEPGRRYASAEALADDLHRFMDDRPIRARPVGRAERLWRWCRRNPALAAATGLALAAAVTAVVVSVSFGIYQTQAAEDLRTALREAETERDRAASRLAENYQDRGLVACTKDGDAALGLLWMCRALEMVPARDTALREEIQTQWEGWQTEVPPLKEIFPHQGQVTAVAFRPDGKAVLTGSGGIIDNNPFKPWGEARLWSVVTGQELTPPLRHQGEVMAVAFSPDGQSVLTGSQDGTARLWSAATGKELTPPLRHQDIVRAVAFRPDGKAVLTGSGYVKTGEARLWSAATGQELIPPMRHQGPVCAVAFSPDGKTVLTDSRGFLNGKHWGEARLWSVASGKELTPPMRHGGLVQAVAFSPDGKGVITGGGGFINNNPDKPWGEARLWSSATGKELTPPLRHQGPVSAVAFSPDSKAVLTGSWKEARLWSAASGQALTPPLRHQSAVYAVAFSPDGQAVLTGSGDRRGGEARLWSAATGQALTPPLRHHGPVSAVAFSPDGQAVLTGSYDKTARLWSVARNQALTPPLRHQGVVSAVAFSPDGKAVLTGSEDQTVRLWSVATGKELTPPMRHRGAVRAVAFSPEGKSVLTGSLNEARLWSATTGKARTPPLRHQGIVRAVVFSPDGQAVLTGSSERWARLWWAVSGKELTPLLAHQGWVNAVALSPDGKVVLTGSGGPSGKGRGEARLWSAASGKALTPPLDHQGRVSAVAFSPDGQAVLTGSGDAFGTAGEARLWSAATGKELTLPMRHQAEVLAVAFSPDGKKVLTGSRDGTARMWSSATGKELTPPMHHQGAVHAVAISPDGKAVLTGSGGFINNKPWGEARLWRMPVAARGDVKRIQVWTKVLTGTEMDEHGSLHVLDANTWQRLRQQLK